LTTVGSTQYPVWSPDGRRIAFVVYNEQLDYEVNVVYADGSGQIALTQNPATDDQPVWSPDGRSIAFHSNRDNRDAIYVMPADGSGTAQLIGEGSAPAWSPTP
jgi:Tol biopolymer transport system component